ncbi:response regulator [Maribacter cobaltidurans]|uniref:DNA-binding response regulator n=1 Tax=Maribacter cobaltidurans TaxID=1178778 RepID=A0A223V6D9_9FLAO|nr:response regulator transcription factor [Maribacter cobaltidurans]ASV30983.1 DNA-binding response regulator [Maribacter cobaltidurans]GGD90226.1 DNA-binding response regulator [Maribacter cobaltidurans]
MERKIRLALVDDNSFLIKAIEDKLSFFENISIKWKAESGSKCLEMLAIDHQLDMILMDIEMPILNGIETTEIVKKKHPQIKIVMLTVFDNDEHIFNAIKAGADGYLLKEIDPESLMRGIHETMTGGAAMTPTIALKALRLLRNPMVTNYFPNEETVVLTKREEEVLEQLSSGLSYTKIAENLHVSPSTVRKHIEHIYTKLQVHNKLEAIEKAKRINLI